MVLALGFVCVWERLNNKNIKDVIEIKMSVRLVELSVRIIKCVVNNIPMNFITSLNRA